MLELTSMVDWSRWSAIFPGDFVYDAGGYFWTSTSYPYGSFPWLQAWAMDGGNGKTWTFLTYYDIAPMPFRVSPVRNTLDTDGDGVLDGEDNCIMVANGPDSPDAGGNIQLDVDGDGYGNICDPDFDNSGIVNAADLAYMKTSFFTPDAEADLDGSGVVNAADLAILKTMFFKPPGPSCCGIPLP